MHGLHKYGRTIDDVLLPDGINVNHTLVKKGLCWWYRKYARGYVLYRDTGRLLGAAGRVAGMK